MRELLVATKNPGKFKEVKDALGGVGFRLSFLGDFEVGKGGFDDSDFVENGETFEENARKKAEYYFEKFEECFADGELFVLGEDSGIIVDALDGELGVKTRRWGAGEQAGDEEWIEYFLERMKNVSAGRRGAEFICCAYLKSDGVGEIFRGETKGVITDGLEAPLKPGIPLSSCFRPDGFDRVYAALTIEEKNKISHRGKAMREVKDFLSVNFDKDRGAPAFCDPCRNV